MLVPECWRQTRSFCWASSSASPSWVRDCVVPHTNPGDIDRVRDMGRCQHARQVHRRRLQRAERWRALCPAGGQSVRSRDVPLHAAAGDAAHAQRVDARHVWQAVLCRCGPARVRVDPGKKAKWPPNHRTVLCRNCSRYERWTRRRSRGWSRCGPSTRWSSPSPRAATPSPSLPCLSC